MDQPQTAIAAVVSAWGGIQDNERFHGHACGTWIIV
jgi:hypothetical protein